MQYLIKGLLATATLAFAAHSFAATAPTVTASTQERAKIEGVVKQYLLKNPEVIIEAVQSLQRKQYEQAEQNVKKTQQSTGSFATPLMHQANDPVAGNPTGKITVVEFFDYQCPHCVDMAPVIEGIIKANNDVRIIFKDFPIRGPMSDLAARVALVANKQGKYYDFSHTLLTANQPLTQDLIYQTAAKIGLDVEQVKKEINDPSIDTQLKNTIKLAQDLKLFGTPAFFIAKSDATDSTGIRYVPGQMDQNQMQNEIDKAKK